MKNFLIRVFKIILEEMIEEESKKSQSSCVEMGGSGPFRGVGGTGGDSVGGPNSRKTESNFPTQYQSSGGFNGGN